MLQPQAFVRAVPDTFDQAIVQSPRPTIDVGRARAQHAAYVAALAAAGYTITTIASDNAHPDCPFIEDAAVVIGDVAVITRPGAESRRNEIEPVAEALGQHLGVRRIGAPGTLDGGDVLQIGDTIYVGRSSRTNDAGIDQLRTIAASDGRSAVAVDVSGVLHLKSAVSLLDADTVLMSAGHVNAEVFSAFRVIEKAPGEEHLASTLHLGDGHHLITGGAERTAARLEAAGFELTTIDMSEFQAADGGLTCLSILIPPHR